MPPSFKSCFEITPISIEIINKPETKPMEINASQYFVKKRKQSIEDSATLKAYILNIYKTMMLRGIRGTYVYVCDGELRGYLKEYLNATRSR